MPLTTRRERGAYFAVAVTVLLLVFFFRTTGIHCDEANYLGFATYSSMGDARLDGKPPLFYAVNFALTNSVGWLLGPNRYWTASLFYLLLNAFSLSWLTSRLAMRRSQRTLFFAIALASPLLLLNATQLMMEAPMLALGTFLFGAVYPRVTRPAPRALVPWMLVLSMMAKDSALPALVALGVAVWTWDRTKIRRYVAWLVAAVVIAKGVRVLCHVKEQWYGGVGNLLHFWHWPARFRYTAAYLDTWLFFVSPLLLIAALIGWYRDPRDRIARGLFLSGAATFAGTIAVQYGVVVDFARYLYPLLWIGVLGWALLAAERGPSWMATLVALAFILQSSGLWMHARPLRGWPAFVVDEALGNYLTVLPGFGTRAWTARAQWRFREVCLRIAESDAPARERFERYFRYALPGTRVFQADQQAQFEACQGAKVTVARHAQARCLCDTRLKYCPVQDLKQMGPAALTQNVFCLP